jgi:hypothetical protein
MSAESVVSVRCYAQSLQISSIFIRGVRENGEKSLLDLLCVSVCPHGISRLPLEGVSWNLIFEKFSKICRENPTFIKILQE